MMGGGGEVLDIGFVFRFIRGRWGGGVGVIGGAEVLERRL